MFDDLWRYDNKMRLFPMMATEIPTLKNGGIRDGGKTVIVHLKRGLRWSNGAEITSADLRFGWQIGMDPASGPACAGTCDVVTSIQLPDRYTAVLRLQHASPPLITEALWQPWPVSWPPFWKNNPHAAALKLVQDPSFDFLGPNYPTDGPYQVVQYVKGARTVLRPMPYYDDVTCGGYIAKIVDLAYTSYASEIAAAASRQVDITMGWRVTNFLPQLEEHAGPYTLHLDPAFTFEHVIFNVDPTYLGQPNPLADTRVRQALAVAVDKPKLIRNALSTGTVPINDLVAWTPWIVTPKLVAPFADPTVVGQWDPLARHFLTQTGHGTALADARSLLASTPWKHGFTLDFVTLADQPTRQVEEQNMAADWARLGVKVNLILVPYPHIFDDWDHGGPLDHGAFQVALFADFGYSDPDYWRIALQSRYIDREQSTHNGSNANLSGIHDAVFDRDFDLASRTVNNKVRSTNYAAIQRELDQQAYWVGLYFRPFISTVDSRVRNYTGSPLDSTWNMYAWKVKGP
jgi:peptide/nickel transport system substrate-binding protein